MAFNLGDILVNIKANTDGLKKGLDDVQNMGDQTKNLGDKIKTGMNVAAAGMAAVGVGLTAYAKNATDYTIDLVKNSTALGRIIGTSTEEASRLSAAMQRMGIDADSAQQMFGIFAKKIEAARDTSDTTRIAQESLQLQIRSTQEEIDATTKKIQEHGDADGSLSLKVETLQNKMAGLKDQLAQGGNAFDKLGISVKNADGTNKGFTQVLGEVADKFKTMPDGPEKTAAALDLFGRSGKDMLKVLNLGSDGIADLEKKADDLGLTLTSDTIVKINDLIQSQKDLKEQTDALKITVGTETAPVLTSFNKTVNDVLGTFLNMKGPVHDATVGVLAFGGPVFTASGAVLGFLANATGAAPALAKMASALKITTAAQWLLNVAMDANPIVLLVIAILAVGAALFYVGTHMQQVGAFMAGLADKFSHLNGWIQLAITAFLPFIGIPLLIISHWDAITQYFRDLWGGIELLFQQHWQTILAVLTMGIAPVIGLIIGNFQSIVNFLGGVVDTIGGIIGAIGSWFGHLPGYAADAIGAVASFFAGLPGRILGAVGDLGHILYDKGRDVIQGFLHGMGSLISTIGSFFLNKLPGWIRDPFKKALGISSPSKVFAGYGKNIVQGLVGGLKDSQDMLDMAMGGINGNILSPVLAAGGSGSGGNSSTTTNSRSVKIGQVVIQDKQDADYFLGRLDRDIQLESMGVSPVNQNGVA